MSIGFYQFDTPLLKMFFPKYLKCGFTYLNNLKIKQKRFILIKIYLPKLSKMITNAFINKNVMKVQNSKTGQV